MIDENDDVSGSSERRRFERTVELLTRENDALRAVLARLHRENVRLAETLLKATSEGCKPAGANDDREQTERSA